MTNRPGGLRFPVKAADFGELAGGRYDLTAGDGEVVPDGEAIDGSTNYVLTVGVKDDGKYDWNSYDGHIADPFEVGVYDSASSPVSGGSGGCAAGAGGFAALLALAFAMKRKNKPE